MGSEHIESPTPDPNIGAAALQSAQTGQDELNFFKSAYDDYSKRQDATDAVTNEVTNNALDEAKTQSQWQQEDRTRYQTVFQPLQDKLVDQATNYDTPERENTLATQAGAAVQAQGDLAAQQTQRQLAAQGVQPGSGRSTNALRKSDLATGLAVAGAENNSRTQTRAQQYQLEQSAIDVGNGLPGTALQSGSLGLSAGSSALTANQSGNSQFLAGTGLMSSGYGGAMTGLNTEAGTLSGLYGDQLSSYSAARQASASSTAGIGSALGGVAGIASLFL